MSPTINANDVIKEYGLKNRVLMGELFKSLNNHNWEEAHWKDRITYSEAFPHIVDWTPSIRNQVGLTLGALFDWCLDHGYPDLNFAVVTKDTGLPSSDHERGLGAWYVETFGTMKLYDIYCYNKGELAALFLKNNMITLDP